MKSINMGRTSRNSKAACPPSAVRSREGRHVRLRPRSKTNPRSLLGKAPANASTIAFLHRTEVLAVAAWGLLARTGDARGAACGAWSHNGLTIAYSSTANTDSGVSVHDGDGDIYTVPASGGAAQDLTPARKSSPAWFTWQASGRILFAESVDGGTAIGTLNLIVGCGSAALRIRYAPVVICC